MKIFYAVQATGNGHISRAMTLLPHLQQYGEVDIFLSGDNAHLPLNGPVKYRSKGISLFYNCNGGLDYWEITRKLSPLRRKYLLYILVIRPVSIQYIHQGQPSNQRQVNGFSPVL